MALFSISERNFDVSLFTVKESIFDMSLFTVKESIFEVKAIAGDTRLGDTVSQALRDLFVLTVLSARSLHQRSRNLSASHCLRACEAISLCYHS